MRHDEKPLGFDNRCDLADLIELLDRARQRQTLWQIVSYHVQGLLMNFQEPILSAYE